MRERPLFLRSLRVALIALVVLVPFSSGALTGYLKIGDIQGESQRAGHEDEIEIHGISWEVRVPVSAEAGSGRTRAQAEIGDIILTKRTDAASPYLFLAVAQGKAFDQITLTASRRNDSGEAVLDYLTITMTRCVITSYRMVGDSSSGEIPVEEFSLNFEEIRYRYVEAAEDHSAGDEHEVEYDIAAGV